MNIILASSSPRRKDLLSLIIDTFQIIPSNLNEEAFVKLARTPEELVVKLALAKAKEVVGRLPTKDVSGNGESETIIISADTIVVLEKDAKWHVLGKPKNIEEAKKMLKSLCDRTHKVFTGMSVLNTRINRFMTDFSVSSVTFKPVSDSLIENYVETNKPLDKAGGYAIQELGEAFVEKTDGSMTGIIGLSLPKLAVILKSFDVPLKPNWEEAVKKETKSMGEL